MKISSHTQARARDFHVNLFINAACMSAYISKKRIFVSVMKKILFGIIAAAILFSCSSHRNAVVPQPEVRTVIVEKKIGNAVSNEDLMILGMLRQGCRNFSTSPMYSTDTWEGRLQLRLTELCNDPMFRNSQLGMVLYDITDGRYLFTVNGEQRMRPASCQKLVTAIAAIELLGCGYSYVPRIEKAGEGWCWDDDITSQMPYSARRRMGITDVLALMMKDSDNKMAESLFWQLSASGGGKPGSLLSVVSSIESVLCRAGIPKGSGYRIADGSGLSLYNYITPQMLNALLVYAWSREETRSLLFPSLPIGGVDGTLKKRFIGTCACNNIFAKTGTVTGVSSLSGYANGGNGHVISFCIINQGIESGAMGRAFQDRVCVALTER